MLIIRDIEVTRVLLYGGVAQLGLHNPELVVAELGVRNHLICGISVAWRSSEPHPLTGQAMLLDELLPIFRPLMHCLLPLVEDTFRTLETRSPSRVTKNYLCIFRGRCEHR